MTADVVSVGPSHTLRDASRVMAERRIGSVLVHDPDGPGPGILTERDIVTAVASGVDLDQERAADHVTTDSAYGSPTWSLDEATAAMRRGGFRHLVVLDAGDVLGIISLRDIVRAWGEASG
jgi:CBS domain-containing protein